MEFETTSFIHSKDFYMRKTGFETDMMKFDFFFFKNKLKG